MPYPTTRQLFNVRSIDLDQFRKILTLKRLNAHRSWDRELGENSPLSRVGAFRLQLLLFCLLGSVACIAFVFDSALTAMTLNYTILMSILGLFLYSHLSSVLTNTDNHQIVSSLPVSSQTAFWATLVYSLKHIAAITCSIAFLSLLLVAYKFGPLAMLSFCVSMLMTVSLVLSLVLTVFGVASRFARQRTLQSVIMYSLIAVSCACLVVLNLYVDTFSEDLNFQLLRSAQIAGDWLLLYPPAWMAGLMELSLGGADRTTLMLAGFSVCIPLIASGLSLFFFSKRYTKFLRKLALNELGSPSLKRHEVIADYFVSRFVVGLFKDRDIARGFYLLTMTLMKTDIGFRLRVYPQLGIVLAFTVLFLYDKYNFSADSVAMTFGFFLFIYAVTCFMASAITNVQYSDHHKAAVIYQALPIDRHKDVVWATILAFIIRFVLPLSLLVLTVCIFLWGSRFIVDVMCSIAVALVACLFQATRIRNLPFSQDMSAVSEPIKILLDFYMVALPIISLATLHYLLGHYLNQMAIIVYSLLMLVGAYVFWRKLNVRLGVKKVLNDAWKAY